MNLTTWKEEALERWEKYSAEHGDDEWSYSDWLETEVRDAVSSGEDPEERRSRAHLAIKRAREREAVEVAAAADAKLREGLTDAKSWNQQLRADGHGAIHDPGLSNRELDRRLRQRLGEREAEGHFVKENMGAGVVTEAPLDLGGEGKKRSSVKATKVHAGDEVRYMEIQNDTDAISDWLTRGGRFLEDYAPALRPGRRSAEAEQIRAELVRRVRELREMGAYTVAVAEVLGCDERTIRRLLRN